MKKKTTDIIIRWIILIIVAIIVWLWAAYIFYVNPTWKSETKLECQDFFDECCDKMWSFKINGWMMFYWRRNIDDKRNGCYEFCPTDCSQYTEERWYFKDEQKKQEYYDNKVKECKKEYEECLQNGGESRSECYECDKYWQKLYSWN